MTCIWERRVWRWRPGQIGTRLLTESFLSLFIFYFLFALSECLIYSKMITYCYKRVFITESGIRDFLITSNHCICGEVELC